MGLSHQCFEGQCCWAFEIFPVEQSRSYKEVLAVQDCSAGSCDGTDRWTKDINESPENMSLYVALFLGFPGYPINQFDRWNHF